MTRPLRFAMQSRVSPAARAFTLVELLVSMAVLSLILVVSLQMVNGVATLSNRTRARVETFQESRAAFESMTRKISQAMLNTYSDYKFPNNDHTQPPINYIRQSELHFISGPGKNSAGTGLFQSSAFTSSPTPNLQSTTHAIFFQAPQGYSAPLASANEPNIVPALASLLNASGFFLSYDTDKNDRPIFLKTASADQSIPAERWRFRLLELQEPTESLQIYFNGSVASRLHDWYMVPLANSTLPAPSATLPVSTHLLAENVVALVILPLRSPREALPPNNAPQQLAPQYLYDSRAYLNSSSDPLAQLWQNQLPPLVKVTMVAIDEKSAARFQDTLSTKTTIPEAQLGLDKLFQQPSTDPNAALGSTAANNQYAADLVTLQATLVKLGISFRVFTTDVSIAQAKWTEN
jgi:uncharacterized protein (TIGR02599 family)